MVMLIIALSWQQEHSATKTIVDYKVLNDINKTFCIAHCTCTMVPIGSDYKDRLLQLIIIREVSQQFLICGQEVILVIGQQLRCKTTHRRQYVVLAWPYKTMHV